jgi:Concanavalin A-like lectin/glucanases superfamily
MVANKSYLCTASYDGSLTQAGVRLTINGQAQTTTLVLNTLNAVIDNYPRLLMVGSSNTLASPAQSFSGTIDQPRIWNRELNYGDVLTMLNEPYADMMPPRRNNLNLMPSLPLLGRFFIAMPT